MARKIRQVEIDDRLRIADAIEGSTHTTPASAGEIAKKLGVPKTLVARIFAETGYVWTGTRWIYRHNPPKAKDE